jgi:hypothetical protein
MTEHPVTDDREEEWPRPPEAKGELEDARGELIDHSPPPPDQPVIRREEDARHRGWFLITLLIVLPVTIAINLASAIWLSDHVWARFKPEIAEIRSFVFQISLVIVGYLFGRGRG